MTRYRSNYSRCCISHKRVEMKRETKDEGEGRRERERERN
jgi:hypothetical protein